MNNLAFHITDIVSNSIRAKATEVFLDINLRDSLFTLRITDNGCGMDAETVARVTNPFCTTRTTRKVGLGLPFLVQNAEQTGGKVSIASQPGKGTEVTACFISSHIDCPPWGDLPGTVAMLITGNPEINISFRYESETTSFALSTSEIKDVLDGMPLSHPKVMLFIRKMIQQNIE